MNYSPNTTIAVPSPIPSGHARQHKSEASDQYRAMCHQEDLPVYRCNDYLSYAAGIIVEKDAHDPPYSAPIDIVCRFRMVEWSFTVVDFAKLHHETVNVAMSLVDRYLSSRCPEASKVMLSCKLYQLACMSALFLAIKMNERTIVNATVFAELSRGSFTAADILRMERIMLKSLGWRVNGPTTHGFFRHIMALTSENSSSSYTINSTFTELCNFQLYLSVGDYFFCSQKPSIIAIAAIMNAVDNSGADDLYEFDSVSFLKELANISEVDLYSIEVQSAKYRLRMLLNNNGVVLQPPSKLSTPTARVSSPICVSRMKHVVSERACVETPLSSKTINCPQPAFC